MSTVNNTPDNTLSGRATTTLDAAWVECEKWEKGCEKLEVRVAGMRLPLLTVRVMYFHDGPPSRRPYYLLLNGEQVPGPYGGIEDFTSRQDAKRKGSQVAIEAARSLMAAVLGL